MRRLVQLLLGQTARVSAVRVTGMLLGLAVTSLAAHMLDPAGFGAYTFVVAVVTMAAIPISFGLRQTLTREAAYAVALDDGAKLRGLLSWTLRSASLAAFAVACALAGWAWFGAEGEMRGELLVGALALLLMPLPQTIAGLLQGTGRVVRSQLPEFVVRPLAIILLFSVYRWLAPASGPVVQIMLGLFAAGILAETLASVFLLGRRIPRDETPAKSAVDGRALTFASLSFGAIASIQVLNNNLDILMIRALGGETQVGLYRAASSLSVLASFALLIVNTATLPRIAGLHQQGKWDELQALVIRGARFVTLAAIVGGSVLLLAGKPLLSVLFGPEFVVAYPALAILTLGQLANAFFGQVGTILNMSGNERMTLTGVALAVVANALLNTLLIPRYGIIGAAAATATSLFLWNFFLAIGLRRRTGIRSTAL